MVFEAMLRVGALLQAPAIASGSTEMASVYYSICPSTSAKAAPTTNASMPHGSFTIRPEPAGI